MRPLWDHAPVVNLMRDSESVSLFATKRSLDRSNNRIGQDQLALSRGKQRLARCIARADT